jgi:DNA-binding NtrC family response regulator
MTLSTDSQAAKHTIVLVDDEPSVLGSLWRVLRNEPYVIRTTPIPEVALDWVDRGDVSLIVADQRMPDMSGSDLLAQVAKRWPNVGRIILTAHPGQEVMKQGMEAGVDFLLYKPWDDEMLRRAIRRLIDEVERAAAETAPGGGNPWQDLGGEGG